MVASSAKREFLRWLEVGGHDVTQLGELPMSLLHEMFPDATPAGDKWDEIKELSRRILLSPGHVRQFRLKAITNSKGWVTGNPSDPEGAEIYRRMYSELTQCTLGRTASNYNYMRACLFVSSE